MTRKTFGRFIADTRRVNQRQFAAELGFSPGYMNDVEKDRTVPSAANIILIARALGVDSGDLFRLLDENYTGEEPKVREINVTLPANSTQAEIDYVRAQAKLAPVFCAAQGLPHRALDHDELGLLDTLQDMDAIMAQEETPVNKNRNKAAAANRKGEEHPAEKVEVRKL